MNVDVTVEGTGETVGEAKWAALRELEQRHPRLAKSAVQFDDDSEAAADARGLAQRIMDAIGVEGRAAVGEDDDAITVTFSGADVALLIGRHGQMIDAVQYLMNAISHRAYGAERKEVVVDAAGYRERRRATLESLAIRTAREVLETGDRVELEPMTAVERKVVHLRLKEFEGVATASEGMEPNRYVVVLPD